LSPHRWLACYDDSASTQGYSVFYMRRGSAAPDEVFGEAEGFAGTVTRP
jgi:hypothetical protein